MQHVRTLFTFCFFSLTKMAHVHYRCNRRDRTCTFAIFAHKLSLFNTARAGCTIAVDNVIIRVDFDIARAVLRNSTWTFANRRTQTWSYLIPHDARDTSHGSDPGRSCHVTFSQCTWFLGFSTIDDIDLQFKPFRLDYVCQNRYFVPISTV